MNARRTLTALLCLPLALPPAQATVLWPQAQPQPAPQKAPSAPSFRAPSATSCDRPVQARVVPGPDWRPQQPMPESAAPAAVEHLAARARAELSERRAMAAKSVAPPAKYMPEPVAAPAAPAAPALAAPHREQAQDGPVTAGVVDDNADFAAYLAFRNRNAQLPQRERDVRDRYLLEVMDATGRGLPDAEVAVQSPAGATLWARTDTAGRVWVHPDAFDPAHADRYAVTARRQGREATATLKRGQRSSVELRLDAAPSRAPARLDLVFLVDATGSMGDEIAKLRASLQAMVREIAALPSRPDLCLGLVAYRDRGDEFLLKSHDLSRDLRGFQRALNDLQADGGGDYPEAMSEAFADTVHKISWRGDGATRLVVLLADAPPQLGREGPAYDETMLAALGKGIKVFSVGASGLDRQGELIQRQIAQFTGGKFVFLTYADAANPSSGPGRETSHDVSNYSVETLDKLVVRLVSQELAALK